MLMSVLFVPIQYSSLFAYDDDIYVTLLWGRLIYNWFLGMGIEEARNGYHWRDVK